MKRCRRGVGEGVWGGGGGGGGGSTNSGEDRGQREQGSVGRQSPSQGFWRQLYKKFHFI